MKIHGMHADLFCSEPPAAQCAGAEAESTHRRDEPTRAPVSPRPEPTTARPVAPERVMREPGIADLTPQRSAEIRRRIASGAYDSPEVVERVARRILETGELRLPSDWDISA